MRICAATCLALLLACGPRTDSETPEPPAEPEPDAGPAEPPLEPESFYCPTSSSESYDDHRCAPGAEACEREEAIRAELAEGAEPRACQPVEAAHCYPACEGGGELRCWDSCFSSVEMCQAARGEDFRSRGGCAAFERAVPGVRLGEGWWCHMAQAGGENADPCYRSFDECDISWGQHEEPKWKVGDCEEAETAACFVTYDEATNSHDSRCFASVEICQAQRDAPGPHRPVGPCQLVR